MLLDQQNRNVELVRNLDQILTDDERRTFITWANELLKIRGSAITPSQKAQQALAITRQYNIILPLLNKAGVVLKNGVWTNRSWSARLGLGAAAVAAVAVGSQGAGIAALGGAIGVPLWIVCGAGGAFVGTLIEEIQKSLNRKDADH